MQPSPYTPGVTALEVPGRGRQLAQIDERLMYMTDVQALVGRIRVDHAARGVGKTSLLREAQRMAEARGALTVWVTAGGEAGLIDSWASEIARRSSDWSKPDRQRLHRLLQSVTVKVAVGVPGVAQVEATRASTPPTPSGTREFEAVIRGTVEVAARHGHRGLVLFIDEIQDADTAGLKVLAHTWQHLQAEGREVPTAVFAAGLADSPEVINKAATFTERFAYRPLELLDADAAAVALVRPAHKLGVSWQPDALERAVQVSQGYPYTLQLLGHATWEAAGRPDPGAVLTASRVGQAEQDIVIDMNAMFRARWEKATPAEHRFVAAMAQLGDGPVERSVLAQALQVTSNSLGPARASLMHKGLIDADSHGKLAFTAPGFAAYIRRVHGSDA